MIYFYNTLPFDCSNKKVNLFKSKSIIPRHNRKSNPSATPLTIGPQHESPITTGPNELTSSRSGQIDPGPRISRLLTRSENNNSPVSVLCQRKVSPGMADNKIRSLSGVGPKPLQGEGFLVEKIVNMVES